MVLNVILGISPSKVAGITDVNYHFGWIYWFKVKNKINTFAFLNKFLLGYICYGGEFVVTIPIRLILDIIYIAYIVSPPHPPPHPT
jgi:hypothetical protein